VIKLYGSVCIDAPAAAVWARCDGPVARGVGAERTCGLVGNATVRERWLAWDEGRSFTYEGIGVPLLKRAVNQWTVHPQGDKTLLTSRAELEIRGGVFGMMLDPILAPIMRRMAPNALARFKYLVEHGQPYPGKPSELPLAPALC
jgi:hypothetical protein